MKHALLITISLLIGVAPLAAHQDTPIQLKDGKLLGLPKEFEPAAFDLAKKTLTISGKVLPLSHSLQSLFPDDRSVDEFGFQNPVKGIPYELKFSASWYHGPSLRPPYLLIKITPDDRDFRTEILVDIESVAILEARVFLKISEERTEVVPVLIDKPASPKPGPDDWLAIIGKWRTGGTIIEITKDRIQTTESGEVVDYPNGHISPKEPGMMTLTLPSGGEETFGYELKGDILALGFQRAGGFGLARLGSKADKDCQRRNNKAEQGGADQPATAPELKSEGKDKPQPESKVRPR
jgi:hypothetical protein